MKLTPGEALWLARRRMGMTAVDFAAAYGVSVERLRDAERDKIDAFTIAGDIPVPGQLSPGEFSALARRRSGLSLEGLAKKRRTTKMTINKQEFDRTQTAIDLARYWAERRINFSDGHPKLIAVPPDFP
jgi:hypothetical protein